MRTEVLEVLVSLDDVEAKQDCMTHLQGLAMAYFEITTFVAVVVMMGGGRK